MRGDRWWTSTYYTGIRTIRAEPPSTLIQGYQAEFLETTVRLSVLIYEAIPTAFVQLEDPDDENVVTRVMEMDFDVNKYDLSRALGYVASDSSFDEDIESMEETVENLAALEEVDGIERTIEKHLL